MLVTLSLALRNNILLIKVIIYAIFEASRRIFLLQLLRVNNTTMINLLLILILLLQSQFT